MCGFTWTHTLTERSFSSPEQEAVGVPYIIVCLLAYYDIWATLQALFSLTVVCVTNHAKFMSFKLSWIMEGTEETANQNIRICAHQRWYAWVLSCSAALESIISVGEKECCPGNYLGGWCNIEHPDLFPNWHPFLSPPHALTDPSDWGA